MDGADRPIPGCSRQECDTFTGDDVRHVVTWQGNATVPKAEGSQFRKLRFFMRKASLYSLQMLGAGKAPQPARYPGVRWEVTE